MQRSSLLFALLLLAASNIVDAQDSPYTDIPPDFDFPATQSSLENFVQTRNIFELRRHGWYLWAGINQITPTGEPIWETWYGANDVFRAPGPLPAGSRTRTFERPRQHTGVHAGPIPFAPGASQFANVLFNAPARNHIQQNSLYLRSTLDAINDGFGNRPWEERNIPDFPIDAVVLKVVWWPVQQTGLTFLPVWDNEPVNLVSPSQPFPRNPENSWKRVVAIEPPSDIFLPGRTTPVPNGNYPDAKIVSLKDFYYVELDQAAANALGGNVQAGDFMAMVAMHVTTKEIPDWVWATYWWHDQPEMDIYATDRIDQVSGVWRNYLMDVAYDFDLPREFDGSPNAVINPYLEARFANGVASNCMTCHGRSVWPQGNVRFLPVTRGENNPFYNQLVFPNGQDPAYDGTRTRLDFLWSLQMRAQ